VSEGLGLRLKGVTLTPSWIDPRRIKTIVLPHSARRAPPETIVKEREGGSSVRVRVRGYGRNFLPPPPPRVGPRGMRAPF